MMPNRLPLRSVFRSESAILLATICLLVSGTPVDAADAAASGDQAGAPITTGYLFVADRFIPGPYLVSANGLKVDVNGMTVFERQVKALPDKPATPVPPVDPGPPPPGLSPVDFSQEALSYWARKRNFLRSTNDFETARRLFVEAVNASDSGIKARLERSEPDGVMLKKEGSPEEFYPIRKFESFAPDPDPVASAEIVKKGQALVLRNELKRGRVVWIVNAQGGIILIPPNKTEDFLRIMCEDSGPELKLTKMVTLNIVKYYDDQWPKLIREFKDGDALRVYRASPPAPIPVNGPAPALPIPAQSTPATLPIQAPLQAQPETGDKRSSWWRLTWIIAAVIFSAAILIAILTTRR